MALVISNAGRLFGSAVARLAEGRGEDHRLRVAFERYQPRRVIIEKNLRSGGSTTTGLPVAPSRTASARSPNSIIW